MQIVYDMLPEMLGLDLSSRGWKEKKLALSYASYFACISNALRDDLLNIHPTIDSSRISVISCGVDAEIFNPAAARNLAAFRQAHGLTRPYFLWTGAHDQQLEDGAKRMVEALKLDQAADFDVVWLGRPGTMEPAWRRDLSCGLTVMPQTMTDPELATAYSGALALVCASPGDSFGLSVLEAMACGCPVITTGSGSPAEVAGHAGLALAAQDARDLLRALERVRTPQVRQGLIEAGLERVGDFSLDRSVEELLARLQQVTRQRCHPDEGEFHRRWKKLRVTQANVDIGLD
jgi:glycosyltransferase involved in cell wall biosynthesis